MNVRSIAFVMLTIILAVVIIGVLLLFGMPPRVVFMPGFAVKSWLTSFGIHIPNAVGVLTTVAVFWVIIVGIRFAIARPIRCRAA